MSRILVDVMPTDSKECPFSESRSVFEKRACVFQPYAYSRCNLEHGEKCKFLVDLESLEIERKIQGLERELNTLKTKQELMCMTHNELMRMTEIVIELSYLEKESED